MESYVRDSWEANRTYLTEVSELIGYVGQIQKDPRSIVEQEAAMTQNVRDLGRASQRLRELAQSAPSGAEAVGERNAQLARSAGPLLERSADAVTGDTGAADAFFDQTNRVLADACDAFKEMERTSVAHGYSVPEACG